MHLSTGFRKHLLEIEPSRPLNSKAVEQDSEHIWEALFFPSLLHLFSPVWTLRHLVEEAQPTGCWGLEVGADGRQLRPADGSWAMLSRAARHPQFALSGQSLFSTVAVVCHSSCMCLPNFIRSVENHLHAQRCRRQPLSFLPDKSVSIPPCVQFSDHWTAEVDPKHERWFSFPGTPHGKPVCLDSAKPTAEVCPLAAYSLVSQLPR